MRLEGWHIIIGLLIIAAVVTVIAVSKASAKNTKAQVGAMASANQPIGYTHNGAPIYSQPQPVGTNTCAILALVFGIFIGLLGIIFGHIARAQIKVSGQAGGGMALAGLIIGYTWLSIWVLAGIARAM